MVLNKSNNKQTTEGTKPVPRLQPQSPAAIMPTDASTRSSGETEGCPSPSALQQLLVTAPHGQHLTIDEELRPLLGAAPQSPASEGNR